ncbi:MAG: hypothetical protein FWE57_12275 [Chitinispirillia bacterium]|nr:hypothetical protein [Chitinispirillia bacterium]
MSEQKNLEEAVGTGKKKLNKWLVISMIAGVVVFSVIIFSGGNKSSFDSPSLMGDKDSLRLQKRVLSSTPSYAALPQNAGVEDRVNAQQNDIDEIRRAIGALQGLQQNVYDDLNKKISTVQTQAQTASSAAAVRPSDVSPLARASSLDERFSAEYQRKVSHFKTNQSNFWSLSDGEYRDLMAPKIPMATQQNRGGSWDDEPIINIGEFTYSIPSGSRIMAVTDQPVSSDHPGFFTAKIIRPEILRGAVLICQNGGQQNNRIPIQPTKIIFKEREYAVSGQIEMGFPGMEGHVNRHYASRALPIVGNAAIGGAFVAWSAQNQGSQRIDTRDVITGAVIEQTLPQVQREIAKFAVDRPNTVTVAAGAQFSILLTNKLEVRY